jgi:lysozyme
MDQNALKSELIHDEGFKLSAYRDSVGLWTIGVGHLLGNEARMTRITYAEAMALLDADIQVATATVFKLVPELFQISTEHYTDVRLRALVNMAFNLGPKLAEFHVFLEAIAKEDWAAAGVAMMQSKWAKQVGNRAVRLRHMIETGENA